LVGHLTNAQPEAPMLCAMHARDPQRAPFIATSGWQTGICMRTMLVIPLLHATIAFSQVIDLGTVPVPVIDPGLPFEIHNANANQLAFVLGANSFTAPQLSDFVVGVDDVLDRLHQGQDAPTVVIHRVEGESGYISLSALPEETGPPFLLTLQGEPIRSFQDEAALLSTLNRLARYLLVALETSPHIASNGSPNPAHSWSEPFLGR